MEEIKCNNWDKERGVCKEIGGNECVHCMQEDIDTVDQDVELRR